MTELIWDGKYINGKKTAPVRIALPFQTIETVNESAQQRQKTLDLFATGRPTKWRNRLIWGDKKYVLPSLLDEFVGKINLIYIDPPFDTGDDFSYKATIPDNPETEEHEITDFLKLPSMIEQKAYRDTWGRGMDSYLQWFYETIILLKDLLSADGSIYVHLDWHIGHYAKLILDEVFGYGAMNDPSAQGLRNEIVWCYTGPGSPGMKQFNRKHDTIFWYTKSGAWAFNDKEIRIPHHEKTKENFKKGLRGSGFVADTYDLDKGGKIPESWWQIAIAARYPIDGVKRVGYPTEKPYPLIERILKASSKEGDLVLDCFCGSGITAAVAEKLNRRWIACDLGRFAIHTTRKRLLGIDNVKPFVVQNLGKYERQQWMKAEFHSADTRAMQEKAYRNFILDLFQAKPLEGHVWLHGARAGRLIHVGSVDTPVSIGDVKSIIQEFWKVAGKDKEAKTNGIDILGWEFAFDINETAKQHAAANNVDVKFKKIPREVLEKRAVEQGDIQFFELASLDIGLKKEGKKAALTLKNFIIPPDDIPEEARKSITHWRQCIDYWAVDWNYKDDTFHNEWQSYRTKKEPNIDLMIIHHYTEVGTYTILVKVIDILGNDTTKAIDIDIK